MDYITPTQAAEKWGISRRSVRQYLANNRIPGVQTVNQRVLIPSNAEKPVDKRLKREKKQTEKTELMNPFVLTCAVFKPGQALDHINSMENKDTKTIALAELNYLQGNTELSDIYSNSLASSRSSVLRIGALLIRALNSFSGDDVHQFLTNYVILQTLADTIGNVPQLKATGDFFQLFLNIIINDNNTIQFPDVSIHAFDNTGQLKTMGVYAYSRWLLLNGNIGRAIGLAEGTMLFMKEPEPVTAIYLSLVVTEGYAIQGAWEKAEYYFRYAWEIAVQDKILMPFAEFRFFLAGLAEKCLRTDYPEEFRKIADLSSRYFVNWTYAHNLYTSDKITSKLSPVEFYVASLAANGLGNEDIAGLLSISVNSVRTHLRNIFNKLDIQSRKALREYVLTVN